MSILDRRQTENALFLQRARTKGAKTTIKFAQVYSTINGKDNCLKRCSANTNQTEDAQSHRHTHTDTIEFPLFRFSIHIAMICTKQRLKDAHADTAIVHNLNHAHTHTQSDFKMHCGIYEKPIVSIISFILFLKSLIKIHFDSDRKWVHAHTHRNGC